MKLIKEVEAANLKWTKNEDCPQDNAIGYAKISESTQMVYFCVNHNFGYGPCWRCFRGELPLEVDPRGVWENDLGEELTENFGLEEEAIMECEEDFKRFMKERQ